MRTPLTLSGYIAKQCLWAILQTLFALAGIILLFDTIELLRRASDKEDIPLRILFEMSLLKLPNMMEQILPFAVLIGSILCLSRLTRSLELVVARAAGVSAWQFLAPAVGVVLLLGYFFIGIFNPMSSAMLARYELLEARYLKGRANLLAISDSGLWLRESVETGNATTGQPKTNTPKEDYIIHALRVSQKGTELFDVIIFRFQNEDRFVGRIDAKTALLQDRHWVMQNALITAPNKPAQRREHLAIPTSMTQSQLQDSFTSPATISFWQLDSFINTLERAGFSALRHRLHWHVMLAKPFLLAAMVMIAASFSLRLPRKGGTTTLIVLGLLTGFVIHFLSDIAQAFGLSGSLPLALAAWSPALIVIMLGTLLVLHFEDG